jgi:GTPase
VSNRRLPVVAVVGRPNVGKSTLFNRVLGERAAIVDDQPGVTRDRNFARADWAGREFFVVDTGGVIEGSDQPLDRQVRHQALAAVEEADLILFVVDGKDGVHPLDERLTSVLRDSGRPVLVVANKMDNLPRDQAHHDFWRLGLGEPVPVSAISGKGSGDLLDRVIAALPETSDVPDPPEALRVAVIGKPNVGKSSFVNRMFDEDRMVVSDVPGTTRDPVDSTLRYHGRELIFVDTAGLRRQSRISEAVEYYSSLRTARVVRDAHVCLVLVDAGEGLHQQDLKILENAWEAGCGVILAVNKWDLVDHAEFPVSQMEQALRSRSPLLAWVPIIFISAQTGLRVRKTLDLVLQVAEERNRRIPTHEVNEILTKLYQRQPPPHSRGRQIRLRYGTQADTAPPTFVLFANLPREIPDHYIRYLYNGFRKAWGFKGVPIRIRLRSSASRDRSTA